MEETSRAHIVRITEAVDVSDLKAQLEQLTAEVSIETEVPDVQANAHWYLPPVVEIQLAYMLVQPFLQKAFDALVDATKEKVAEKGVETIGGSVVNVFRRAMKFIGRQGGNGVPTAPAPPMRMSFDVTDPRLSKPIRVSLVFPEDLTDGQIRSALATAETARQMAEEQVKQQGEMDDSLRNLIAVGRKEEAYDIMETEEYDHVRRPHVLYVYRPDEGGWLDLDEVHREESKRIIEGGGIRRWSKE